MGVPLQIDHTAQLVYSNPQDMRCDSSHQSYCKWTKTTKLLNRSALLLYNACTLLSMEICVTDTYKLTIHPKGMATLKKYIFHNEIQHLFTQFSEAHSQSLTCVNTH